MKEYSIDLHRLIESYTKTELIALYSEGKKRQYKDEFERFKSDIKAVRLGIIEALKGVETIKDESKVEEKTDTDVLTEAGFKVQQL